MTHHPQKKSKKQQRFEALNDDEPEATGVQEQLPASSLKVKKSIKKETENKQIPPGQIGIQRLRELLEDAKNKQKLSTQDASAYTAMFEEWRSAKGNAKLKKENVVGLREIYKRVLYKK